MSLLKIKKLRKGFGSPDGEWLEVINVDQFDLHDSEHVALKGGSGSGKTTFLHMIAGILRPDSGSIEIDKIEISGLSEQGRDALRAGKLGYIFQTFNLLQGFTALENVLLGMAFGNGVDKKHALELLDRVGLARRADYIPKQLSVGQQQRVAVARALANRPRLVLADEPTGNLDRRTAADSLDLIREVCTENEAALLLVSHDQEILSGFEKVADLQEINQVTER